MKKLLKDWQIILNCPKRILKFYRDRKVAEKLLISANNLILIIILVLIASFLGFREISEKITELTFEDKIFKEIVEYWDNFDKNKVKGIYLTASTFVDGKKLQNLIDLVNRTELNAMVIDVKDGTDVYLGEEVEKKVAELLAQKIYPIARIAVFIDNSFAKIHPESALKNPDGSLWRDRKGFVWLDPADKGVWEYNLRVATRALKAGFKEVQFDYVRFPSDGNLEKIVYPVWDKKMPRNEIIKSFFEYLTAGIRDFDKEAILSADLFAFSFVAEDDMNVGQIVSDAVPVFDYISPMIYPSHYRPGNFGFLNPAEHPYEVVYETLKKGQNYFIICDNLTSSDDVRLNCKNLTKKIRPWIQDFDIGAVYDAEMIKKEIQAIYDFGLSSWMLWNPDNVYTEEALEQN